jgi:hypothetical protein
MSDAYDKFLRNVGYARDLVALYASLGTLTTSALDNSDLLRAALVGGISALDDYVHTVVRKLMVAIADGTRPPTDAFNRFAVPLHETLASASLPAAIWLDRTVKAQHAYVAFQQPDRVADAFRLVSSIELWNEVSGVIGVPASDLKTQLKLIVTRRNQIVHEADCDPTPPHSRWPISISDATGALDFVTQVVSTIDGLL